MTASADLKFTAPHVLPLEGGQNFREVGGYPANVGSVRKGLVWRSASLDRLTPADCAVIEPLGIRTVVDFRTEHERRLYPSAKQFLAGKRVLTGPDPDFGREHTDRSPWAEMSPEALRGEMMSLYLRIAEAHSTLLGDMLRALAEDGGPVLIHCTAGKDRTGVAVALLLVLLGVDREAVLWDYEQTRHHLDRSKLHSEAARGVGGQGDWLADLSPAQRDVVFGLDRNYLVAALDALEAYDGGAKGYATGRLGLPDKSLDDLKGALVCGV